MEHGYWHTDRGYWQTNDDPPQHILDGYPVGTVEVPVQPGAGYTWDGVEWQPPTAEAALAGWRAGAAMTRADFAIAAFKASLVTEQEAENWAAGSSLPQWVVIAIDAAFATPSERLAARVNAKTAEAIARSGAIIEILREAADLTDEDIDTLFGGAP